MVSFSCEVCNDTIKKPKLDAHKGKCRGAYFTCLDCNTTFNDGEHKSHTSCISEAQKYQGALYKPEKGKGKGNKNGQEANGKPSNPATPVEKESPEVEVGDAEMTDAAPIEAPIVGENSEDEEEEPTKKDSEEKKEKARKHKKERRERKKEAKKKAAEEAKKGSKPTEKPAATVAKSKPVDSTEETLTTEMPEKKSEKKDKKSKKDRKAKKDEPTTVTEDPKAEEAAIKAVVAESKPVDAPEAPATVKPEKKEKKSKADKKRKLDEAVPETTNGITEIPETALPAAETKPEESSPTKKAKKENLSSEVKDLAESFLAIFREGHPLTLGKALARLGKVHGADAQKRLLEIIRLKKVKGELVVSIS